MDLRLRYSALVLLACISSLIQPSSANKTVPCDKTGCKDSNTYCELTTGKCMPKPDCSTIRCRDGYKCYEGKCVLNTTCTPACSAEEECQLVEVQCIRAPCYPVPECKPNKCASVSCPNGQVCENGECVLDAKCALVLCKTDTICFKGSCFEETECQPGQCTPRKDGLPNKCYRGREACSSPSCPEKTICWPDRCAVVRCTEDTRCFNGQCMPIDKCA